LPRKLKHELADFDVQTVPQAGWAGKKNGELLQVMAGTYDVFITIDNNLYDQQKLQDKPIGFVVLSATNSKLETLIPLMKDVREALKSIQPGQVVRVSTNTD
ncbi:MAG: hypothetical protein AAF125_19430, partial [Chloroflexota bacterium]